MKEYLDALVAESPTAAAGAATLSGRFEGTWEVHAVVLLLAGYQTYLCSAADCLLRAPGVQCPAHRQPGHGGRHPL